MAMSSRQHALVTTLLLAAWHGAEAQGTSAILTGTVLADSLRTPIEGAELSLPRLSKRALTTAAGRFRIDSIPAGTHDVVVRKVGFSPAELKIAFVAGDSVDQTISLRGAQALQPVAVEGQAVIQSFEEHRALGLGTFITRAELERKEQQRLSEVLGQVRGARIQNVGGGRAFLYSGRRMATSIDYRATKGDFKNYGGTGANPAFCYPQVFMNDQLVFRGEEGEVPFDINSISTAQVEAIEYYTGPGSTPMRYTRLNSPCGAIVLHTRRTFSKPKP
jgi:hypothetical protein